MFEVLVKNVEVWGKYEIESSYVACFTYVPHESTGNGTQAGFDSLRRLWPIIYGAVIENR